MHCENCGGEIEKHVYNQAGDTVWIHSISGKRSCRLRAVPRFEPTSYHFKNSLCPVCAVLLSDQDKAEKHFIPLAIDDAEPVYFTTHERCIPLARSGEANQQIMNNLLTNWGDS